MNTLQIQTALKRLSYPPGPLDGISGASTRKAIREFQADHGLLVDGIAGKETIKALSLAVSTITGLPPAPAAPIIPPWYEELLRKKGLHELRDRSALMAWLRSDGKTLGDPSKLPWCGDAIETCIAKTLPDEPLPANPYLARNWLKFGVPLSAPTLGCVLVFWRGSRAGTNGHVGLYAGEEKDGTLHVLGGNQSDAITIARLDRGRLLGMRWPSSYPRPTGGKVLLSSNGTPLSINEA